MPPRAKGFLSLRPPRPQPRYIDEDEHRQRLGHEWYGLPSAIDRWVAPAQPISFPDCNVDAKRFAKGVARCLLMIEWEEGAVDGMLQDPDTYTLFICAILSEEVHLEQAQRLSPWAVLDVFVGGTGHIAVPAWAKWSQDVVYEMWDRRSHVADVFTQLARDEAKSVQLSIAVELCAWAERASEKGDEKQQQHVLGRWPLY